MGGRGKHDIKGGKYGYHGGHLSTYRLYILEMFPLKILLHVALVFYSVHLSERLEG